MNVVGGLLMGLLAGYFALNYSGGGQSLRLFLATGILGGFTTFSAFSLDAVLLWERGEVAPRRLRRRLGRPFDRRASRSASSSCGRSHEAVETRKVDRDEAGMRLDRWFKRHYPGPRLRRICRS